MNGTRPPPSTAALLACALAFGLAASACEDGPVERLSSTVQKRADTVPAQGSAPATDTVLVADSAEPADTSAPPDTVATIDTASPDTTPADTTPADATPADTAAPVDTTPCDPCVDPSCPGQCPTTPPRVCYQGEHNAWNVCFDLVPRTAFNVAGYNYPASSDPRYQPPVNYLDLDNVPPESRLALNFRLDEFLQAWKGRYGVFSAQTVARFQAVRSQLGVPLYVNSGYRNPQYNASVGGATFSRHMYGDAADVTTQGATSLQAIANACNNHGAGFVLVYTSHVHCDWRDDPLGHDFWPQSPASAPLLPGPPATPHAELPPDLWADVALRAPDRLVAGAPITLDAVWGDAFDEGIPWVRWEVRGPDGALVTSVEPSDSLTFTPLTAGPHLVGWSVGELLVGEIVIEVE